MNTQRIILHIDMNSYFASVEQQANPLLRGRPVGVCEHLGGIIIAPSVEAKRLGITLGTPVWDALKIFPDIALLPTDPDKYRSVTDRFMRVLRDYTDEVERYSIDEAFVDITNYCNGDYREALFLGLEIKQRLRLEVGEWVSCSIGVGPNKLVSKIAAELDGGILKLEARNPKFETNYSNQNSKSKTLSNLGHSDLDIVSSFDIRISNLSKIDRICVIKPEQVKFLYNVLELTDIPGIGNRYQRRLNQLGIHTLMQLAQYPVANLINQFGVSGYFLHEIANFRDTSEVILERDEKPKSIGHAYTMPRATSDVTEVRQLMFKLSEKVGRRLRAHHATASTVHYFHSNKKYQSFSKQKKIKDRIFDSRDIYKTAYAIYRDSGQIDYPIKIMGVTVSGLNFNKSEEPLFEKYKRPIWLVEALDKINDKYGEFTLRRARFSGVPEKWAKETVGFGRTKQPRR